MSTLVAGVTAALAAAACFGAANTLQHKGASRLPNHEQHAPALVWQLVTQPCWLGGIAVNLLGLGLHAVALSVGALAVIQPLLVSGLLFTLPVSRVVTGRRVDAADYWWAALVVVGLSVFLLSASVSGGHAAADVRLLAVGLAGAGVLLALAVALSTRRRCRHRATLLGTSTGVCCGVVAALLKQVASLALAGPAAVLGGWPFYALLVAGGAALWFGQTAYRAGPLIGSLPAITIVDPVVAIALGVLAFGESIALDPLRLTVELVAFTAMAAGVVSLARRSLADAAAQGVAAAQPDIPRGLRQRVPSASRRS